MGARLIIGIGLGVALVVGLIPSKTGVAQTSIYEGQQIDEGTFDCYQPCTDGVPTACVFVQPLGAKTYVEYWALRIDGAPAGAQGFTPPSKTERDVPMRFEYRPVTKWADHCAFVANYVIPRFGTGNFTLIKCTCEVIECP